jgi:hypothetical protein
MAFEIATINFDDLEIITPLGWRQWSNYKGQFDLDNSGDICAIRIYMRRPGARDWRLESIVPEDGQQWEDLYRTLKQDYAGQITDLFDDWYRARPDTEADRKRDMAVA